MRRLITLVGCLALATPTLADPDAGAPSGADHAIVITNVGLSVTGLKTRYALNEPIELTVVVPRQNVLRARTEVVIMRGDVAGAPLYQDLRDYDRYTDVQALHFSIALPRADRRGQLALLVRVRGLRNAGEGTPAEAFEDVLTYRISFAQAKTAVVEAGQRLKGRAYFGFDSDQLDPQSVTTLRAWAKALKAQAGIGQIRVEGHADMVGGSNYNLALSRRRAETARATLIAQGVPGHMIQVVGFGFDRPDIKRAAATSEQGVWENRRAEVVWFPKAKE